MQFLWTALGALATVSAYICIAWGIRLWLDELDRRERERRDIAKYGPLPTEFLFIRCPVCGVRKCDTIHREDS